MDPNETLTEIRALIARQATEPYGLDCWGTDRLVDLIDGLDRWITYGGFLPDLWQEI